MVRSCSLRLNRRRPEATSQTLTSPSPVSAQSPAAEARVVPSGEEATLQTRFACASRTARARHVLEDNSTIVPSSQPRARLRPAGEKTALTTGPCEESHAGEP